MKPTKKNPIAAVIQPLPGKQMPAIGKNKLKILAETLIAVI
jgi:hypothetical protein